MKSSEPKNCINKQPSTVATLSGSLKDGASVTDPVVLVELADLPAANYAQIPEFNGRFYYIKDIVNVANTLWEIRLHVDVLKTYASAIMNAPCIVAKTASNNFNLYLPDPNFKCQQNDIFAIQAFPEGFYTDADHVFYYLTFFG
jgi:hypothetical protein